MSPQMARDAVGMMLVSGPQSMFDAVRDALAEDDRRGRGTSATIRATAAAYKLFGNSMLFVITAGVTDVFAMAKGLGIAPADALPCSPSSSLAVSSRRAARRWRVAISAPASS